MPFILPDKILDSLICDICNKYLSVQPVRVYPNRRIKCGRCVRNKKTGDGAVSLFGLIADACLFKCINRFDGCSEFLFHSQVRDHEKMCISKIYRCPICPESDELTSLLLEQHFRKRHRQSVLKYPGFFINLCGPSELTEIFLYRLEELLFFVTFIYSQPEDTMRFDISLVGTSEQANNIMQQFWISDDEAVGISTEKKPCTSFEMENDWFCIKQLEMDKKSVMVKFDLEINNPQFIRITNSYHSSLESNNKLVTLPSLMTPVIGLPFEPMVVQFKLRKLHSLGKVKDISLSPCATAIIYFKRLIYLQCINCYELCCVGDYIPYWYACDFDKEYSLCYFCFKFLKCHNYIREEDYTQIQLLQHELVFIKFSCKWACGKRFSSISLFAHEEICPSLNQICSLPKCNYQATIYKNIKEHFIEEHTEQDILRHYYHGKLAIGEIVLFVNNQFVFIDIEEQSFFRRRIVMKSDTENVKLVAFLFDDSKRFLTKFSNQVIVSKPYSETANYYLKVIVLEQNTATTK